MIIIIIIMIIINIWPSEIRKENIVSINRQPYRIFQISLREETINRR